MNGGSRIVQDSGCAGGGSDLDLACLAWSSRLARRAVLRSVAADDLLEAAADGKGGPSHHDSSSSSGRTGAAKDIDDFHSQAGGGLKKAADWYLS